MLKHYLFKLILSYYEGLIQYQGNHFPCPSTRTITHEAESVQISNCQVCPSSSNMLNSTHDFMDDFNHLKGGKIYNP